MASLRTASTAQQLICFDNERPELVGLNSGTIQNDLDYRMVLLGQNSMDRSGDMTVHERPVMSPIKTPVAILLGHFEKMR